MKPTKSPIKLIDLDQNKSIELSDQSSDNEIQSQDEQSSKNVIPSEEKQSTKNVISSEDEQSSVNNELINDHATTTLDSDQISNELSNDSKSKEVLIKDLDEFKTLVRNELNVLEDSEFDHKLNALIELCQKYDASNNRFMLLLMTYMCDSMAEQKLIDKKMEIFQEYLAELQCYIAMKPKIDLSSTEIEERKVQIRQLETEIKKLDRKVKILEAKEIDLDDLQDDDTTEQIFEISQLIIAKYKKLRNLQNKYVYFGEQPIDFSDLTSYPELNSSLNKSIISKFNRDNVVPDYNDFLELIEDYHNKNPNPLITIDNENVFRKICLKLKQQRQDGLMQSLNAYINPVDEMPVESEELKEKLDKQNNFKEQIDEILAKYVDKAIKCEDEETESITEDSSKDSSLDQYDESTDNSYCESSDCNEEIQIISDEEIILNRSLDSSDHVTKQTVKCDQIHQSYSNQPSEDSLDKENIRTIESINDCSKSLDKPTISSKRRSDYSEECRQKNLRIESDDYIQID